MALAPPTYQGLREAVLSLAIVYISVIGYDPSSTDADKSTSRVGPWGRDCFDLEAALDGVEHKSAGLAGEGSLHGDLYYRMIGIVK